ncbi:ADP-ribosyltransferase [Sphingobacterium faecium]|uniref:ADP-ribosyltransferase n=1 Tax=Sphingobacterium faecium TaxID=34087 RepID=UPI003D363AD3
MFDPYFKLIEQEKENNQIYSRNNTTTHTALSYYAGDYSRLVNGYLRYPTHNDNRDLVQDHISILNGEFEKNILHENIVVVRKIRNHFIPKTIKIGSILTDRAFLSTSLDLNYRKSYDGDTVTFN